MSTVLTNQKLTLLYFLLRESGYAGPAVIDATDTDVYIAAYISHQLPGMLCIKRKQETILCCSLVSEDMARCIIRTTSLYYRLPTQVFMVKTSH